MLDSYVIYWQTIRVLNPQVPQRGKDGSRQQQNLVSVFGARCINRLNLLEYYEKSCSLTRP